MYMSGLEIARYSRCSDTNYNYSSFIFTIIVIMMKGKTLVTINLGPGLQAMAEHRNVTGFYSAS